MSSLQDIMNVDEDPELNKRPKDPTPSDSRRQPHQASTPASSTHARYSSEGKQVTRLEDTILQEGNNPPAQSTSPSLAGPSQDPPQTTEAPDLEHNCTSSDVMDPPYGHTRSGSSGHYSNTPMRPFVNSPTSDTTRRLTPVTGRVSRAKKGVPVHTCDQCRPPKIFTRAEHLRRHQLSHETPKYACQAPACDKAFHRKDLLERHQQRHEVEGDPATKPGNHPDSRRPSTGSTEGVSRVGMAAQGYRSASSAPNVSMAPGMTNTPAYQSMGSPALSQSMSPQLPGDSYQPSTSGSQGYSGGYQLSDELPRTAFGIQEPVPSGFDTPPSMTVSSFSGAEYSQPRTTPGFSSLFVRTEGLPDLQPPTMDMTPELSYHQDAWPSSATDSPYSAPSEHSRAAGWSSSQRASSVEWQNSHHVPSYQSNGSIYYPFTTSPPLGTTQIFSSYDVLPFSEDPSIVDLHQHGFVNTVRSTTPPLPSTLAQGSEVLVSSSTALPSDRLMSSLACLGRQKEVAIGLLASPALVPSATPSVSGDTYRTIPEYLDVYWKEVQPIFPIVHRRSFEGAAEQLEALRYAMAALATQHLSGKEHHTRGIQLHDCARQRVIKCTHWDVPVMQAILLCEFFNRFRGRKAVIHASGQFRNLYARVLHGSKIYDPVPMESSNDKRWNTWLDQEAHRRILAGCFMLDVHASVYHEQPRVRNLGLTADDIHAVPLSSPSQGLWQASSANSWAALVANTANTMPLFMNIDGLDSLDKSSLQAYTPFDKSIILAHELLRTQTQTTPTQILIEHEYEASQQAVRRIEELFPECPVANTYLALHHTPLHDLLAVSGDSWIFSQKLLEESSFSEQKRRLQQWSASPKAAAAAVYACRALQAFTSSGDGMGRRLGIAEDDEQDTADWTTRSSRMWRDDISNYWAMYVCALVCWAFGHMQQAGDENCLFTSDTASDASALAWVQRTACLTPADAMMCRSHGDSMAVVRLASRWLGADVCHLSLLYKDAVRVLKGLEERPSSRWF